MLKLGNILVHLEAANFIDSVGRKNGSSVIFVGNYSRTHANSDII